MRTSDERASSEMSLGSYIYSLNIGSSSIKMVIGSKGYAL